jgi:hypothetical protein
MKKLLPLALLLCLSFSLSSFAPAHKRVPKIKTHTIVVKGARAISFPVTGTVDGSPGAGQLCTLLNYSISGGGDVPSSITLTYAGNGFSAGPYTFSNGGSGNTYYCQSQDLRNKTGIIYVQFVVTSGSPGYSITFGTIC